LKPEPPRVTAVVAAMTPSETMAPTAGLFKLFGRWATVVNDSARLYACARCHCHVVICRRCDRGNIYCPACAPLAWRESRRRSAAAYQRTDGGRRNHAARQQLYLIGLEESEKMTHQGLQVGSAESPCVLKTAEDGASANAKETQDATSNQPLPKTPTLQCGGAHSDGDDGPQCDFCGDRCSAFLRLDKLPHPTPVADGVRAAHGRHSRMDRPRECRPPRAEHRCGPSSAPTARAPPRRA